MSKHALNIILNFEELCQATRLPNDVIIELVELHLLIPEGRERTSWQFDEHNLRRAKIAANLHRDLEINLQGVALAIELLEKIEKLETELQTLQKIFT
jgi:chaperone modulatory protein CbpM